MKLSTSCLPQTDPKVALHLSTVVIVTIFLIIHTCACFAAPIHDATKQGDTAQVNALLQGGVDVNSFDTVGNRPLFYAALEGNKQLAIILLEAGADPNLMSKGNTSPLLWAVGERDERLLRLLIAKGADVNARSESRFSTAKFPNALQFARSQGFTDMESILIQAGADPTTPRWLPEGWLFSFLLWCSLTLFSFWLVGKWCFALWLSKKQRREN